MSQRHHNSGIAQPATDALARRWERDSGLVERVVTAMRHAALRLAATFEREMESGRGFLWLPVAFAAGILIYFALPEEPWLPAIATAVFVLGFATVVKSMPVPRRRASA